jgi:ketosteroid isomerase-like protein
VHSAKDIAWSWFEHLNSGRIDAAMAMLDDDGTWWNVGPRTAVPIRDFKHSAREILGLMPMRFTLHDAIEQGDRVLLEIESRSPRPGGGEYNNRYCYVFELGRARIRHVREYPDTRYAAEQLPAAAWQAEQATWRRHHDRYWHEDASAPTQGDPMTLPLEDYELIRQVTYRYYRAIDTGDFATAYDCFTPDATMLLVGGSYRFEQQSRDAIIGALRTILHGGVAAMHTAHHPEIRLLDADSAEGVWYLTDWAISLEHRTVTGGACLVRNRYARVGTDWRIRHYGYTRIYEQSEQLDRLPQISAHALRDATRQPSG